MLSVREIFDLGLAWIEDPPTTGYDLMRTTEHARSS